MRLIPTLLASAAMMVSGFAAQAQTIAFTGATIWTGSERGTVQNGTLIVEDGEISAIGPRVRVPPGAQIVDASGKWITPGIIAPFTRMGLVEVPAEDSTNDTSASGSRFSVALDASRAFNPAATPIDITRIEGVTRIVIAPSVSSSLFAGQGFVADTSGELRGSMTKRRAFQYIELGESGAGRSGGSREAAWRYLNGALLDARTYPARYVTHDNGDSLSRADAEALIPVTRGEMPLLIRANRASDLLAIVDFQAQNANPDITIVGATEGWMVADELAAAEIPVIIDPFDNLPSSFESLAATMHNAERLIEAGVLTAFTHFEDDGHQARLVLQSAGNAVANGVSHDDALAAITTAPAMIFGLEDLGSLERGKTADLVVWDGDPLEVMTNAEAVYIAGEAQSLVSRQTRLRDRYLSLDESERPLAYSRGD
tara:strand:- start:1064 stop:2347 length:1284 start_codon:yes stop_codon:yes gene_type:complete